VFCIAVRFGFTLKREHGVTVFENKELKRIFRRMGGRSDRRERGLMICTAA
jgi:hypothetical protein